MSAQDLKDKIRFYPGLVEKDAETILELLGVRTLEQLGRMSDSQWAACISQFPEMRVDHPEDLFSVERFGPGHLNSLDEIRAEAKKAVQRQRRVQRENRTFSSTRNLTNEGDLSILDDSLDDTNSCDADIDSDSSVGSTNHSLIDVWNIVSLPSEDESHDEYLASLQQEFASFQLASGQPSISMATRSQICFTACISHSLTGIQGYILNPKEEEHSKAVFIPV